MQRQQRWWMILALGLMSVGISVVCLRLPPRPQPMQRLEDNWITSTICSAPCWESFSPGATLSTDIPHHLAQNTRVTRRALNEIPPASTLQLPPNMLVLSDRATNTEYSTLYFEYDERGAPSVLYEIAIAPHPALSLDDMIGWFGYPSAYRFQQVNFETPQRYYLMLYYAQPRMQVMTSAIEVVNGQWNIVWSQPILLVSYLSPQAYTSRAHGCWWRSITTLSQECSL